MSKVRKYRVALKNTFSEEELEAVVEDELGDVEIVNYDIEETIDYEAPVHPGDVMPQRLYIVTLEYKEKDPK
jgi:hypothetical protein